MPSFRIGLDLSALDVANAPLGRDMFPTLSNAVKGIAEAAQRQWRAYAAGADLPGGGRIEPRSGAYGQSILLRQTGDFSAEVYSELPYARAIEEGTPERDMKRMLSSSLKVRMTKDGRRYLIIPFRHDKPGSVVGTNHMPETVANWWQGGREHSFVKRQVRRPSGEGSPYPFLSDPRSRGPHLVAGWKYHWGDRLTKEALEALGVAEQQSRRLEGMVNFRHPKKQGSASHSQFITFRVMMEGSPGWIAPARPGLFPARTTADQLRPAAEEAFRAAVAADISRLTGG